MANYSIGTPTMKEATAQTLLTFNFQPASSTTPQAALVARIQKVDVVARAAGASQLPGATDPSGPDEELVASFV